MDRIIGIQELARMLGRHRSRIHVYQKTGVLPPALMLNGRTIGWCESDILEWMKKNKHDLSR